MSQPANLYQRDFVMWTEEQATLLRHAKDTNLPLDWENLAEEIESLGKSQRSELNSRIRRILRHLIKLEFSPAAQPRSGWRATIRDARAEIEELLEASPSLRRAVDELVNRQGATAAKLAADDLEEHGEPADAVRVRDANTIFTAEQVLGDWYPEPPNAASAGNIPSAPQGR
jgi:hypothetical protein